MATNNRVFVSPGVYTSEVDLTFVAQSVGVTTLGLVGETVKGPAFEPILLSNFNLLYASLIASHSFSCLFLFRIYLIFYHE